MIKKIFFTLLALCLIVALLPHDYPFSAKDLLVPKEELPDSWSVKSTISGHNNKAVLDDFPFVLDVAIEEYIGSDNTVLGKGFHAIYPNYISVFYGVSKYGLLNNVKPEVHIKFHNQELVLEIWSCSKDDSIQMHMACRYVYVDKTIVSRLDIVLDESNKYDSELLILFQKRINMILSNN